MQEGRWCDHDSVSGLGGEIKAGGGKAEGKGREAWCRVSSGVSGYEVSKGPLEWGQHDVKPLLQIKQGCQLMKLFLKTDNLQTFY